MKLLLQRNMFGSQSTIGILSINDIQECVTLEDVDRQLEDYPKRKVKNKTAIPRGTYKIVSHFSNHFKRIVPMLVDVPNFTYVYIHWGNDDEDTDGCILVGTKVENIDFISQSVLAFNKLFDIINQAWENEEEVTIEII